MRTFESCSDSQALEAGSLILLFFFYIYQKSIHHGLRNYSLSYNLYAFFPTPVFKKKAFPPSLPSSSPTFHLPRHPPTSNTPYPIQTQNSNPNSNPYPSPNNPPTPSSSYQRPVLRLLYSTLPYPTLPYPTISLYSW